MGDPIYTRIIAQTYQSILKPLFFRLDPEDVHDRTTMLGNLLGRTRLTRRITRAALHVHEDRLVQQLHGLTFPNPLGLAAGFDKNANLAEILPDVGFGFAELGSVTGQPCTGNPRPRLWRLPDMQSLRVYYGLKNDGAAVIAQRLRACSHRIPIGISAAKTNSPETVAPDKAVEDYIRVLTLCAPVADYFTINISCPNAFGGQPFTDPKLLDDLLAAVDDQHVSQPIFLKLSPDLSQTQLATVLAVALRHRVDGFISTNLTKNVSASLPGKGGVSGRAVAALSDAQISFLYQQTEGKKTIIGCGGIFTAEDAYQKIRRGASLLQLITGMVYQGPQVIGQLNRGIVERLKRDGFSSIREAVGTTENLLRSHRI